MKCWPTCVATVLLVIGSPAHAAVKAWLDATEIAPDDTVELTLQLDEQNGGQPDLSPLQRDFDVVSTRSSMNIQIINGRTSAGTQVTVSLSPKHAGRLTIPSIAWNGDRSPPLPLNVTPDARGASAAASDRASAKTFLEVAVDQKQPYVQAAVAVTVRIYTAETLYQVGLDLPISSDALVMQVGSDENSETERDGERYHVLTRHYVVFPQRSGQLRLTGPVLSAEIPVRQNRRDPLEDKLFDGFFDSGPFARIFTTMKPLRLHGEPIALDVQPRPSSAVGDYWLPARQVTLTGQWHPDSLQAHAGEPVTVDLGLQAVGLTAEQLPDMAKLLTLPSGLKSYPDQPKLTNATQDDTVVGSRRQSIALIADQAGHYSVPALQLHWWDSRTNKARIAMLPARALTVLPAVGAAATQGAAATVHSRETTKAAPAATAPRGSPGRTRDRAVRPSRPSFWPWVSVGCIVLWLATLAAWFFSHRKRRSQLTASTDTDRRRLNSSGLRAAFHEACRNNEALKARRALLDWVTADWPTTPPVGLNGLARAGQNEHLSTLLWQLDRACFAGGEWHGAPLSEALTQLPIRQQPVPPRGAALPTLYH